MSKSQESLVQSRIHKLPENTLVHVTMFLMRLCHLGEVIVPGCGGAGQTIEGGGAALTQGQQGGLGVVTG